MRNTKIMLFLGLFVFSIGAIAQEKEPFAGDYYMITKNELKGIVNQSDEEVVPPLYDAIYEMQNNRGYLLLERDGYFSFFDLDRQRIVSSAYHISAPDQTMRLEGRQSLLTEDDAIPVNFMGKHGIIGWQGNVLMRHEYDTLIWHPENNTLLAFRQDTFAMFAKKGYRLTPFNYTEYLGVWGDHWVVRSHDRWLFLNKDGNLDAKLSDDNPKSFLYHNGAGVLSPEGKVLVPFEYESVLIDNDTEAVIVRENNLYGLYNFEGERIKEPQYDKLEPGAGGLFLIEADGRSGTLDKEGNEIWE